MYKSYDISHVTQTSNLLIKDNPKEDIKPGLNSPLFYFTLSMIKSLLWTSKN